MEVDYRRAMSPNALLNMIQQQQCDAVMFSRRLSVTQGKRLGESLVGNSTLKALDIRGTRLDDEGLTALAQGLEGNVTLQLLDIGENVGSSVGLSSLCESLAKIPCFQEFGLRRCKLGLEGCGVVESLLRSSTSLKVIYLAGNKFGDKGASMLAEALKSNIHLLELYLATNDIKDEGAAAIGSMLLENKTLTTLSLKSNLVKSRGTEALLNGVSQHPTVKDMDLRGNVFSSENVPLLVRFVTFNPQIRIRVSTEDLDYKNRAIVDNMLSSKSGEVDKERRFKSTLYRNAKGPWQRSKLMVVGEGRTGKTATVRSLLGVRFNPSMASTIGIELTESKTDEDGHIQRIKGKSSSHALQLAHRIALGEYSSKEPKLQESGVTQDDRVSRRLPTKTQTVGMQEIAVIGEGVQVALDDEGNRKEKERETAGIGQGLMPPVKSHKNNHKEDATSEDLKSLRKLQTYSYDSKLYKSAEHEKDSVSISIWDFGGQRVFQTLHHLFLTQYGVYLLVFSISEAQQDFNQCKAFLKYWLSSICIFANTAPIIMVGTYFDQALGKSTEVLKLVNDHISTSFNDKLLSNVAKNTKTKWFVPISNATGYGISRLREHVKVTVESQKHVYHRVSVNWMRCLDLIRETTATPKSNAHKPYISLSSIKTLAKSVGIRSADEVERMLVLFHQFGVLLYFTATETLRTQIITEPQWLIDQISKAIRDRDLHSFNQEAMLIKGLDSDLKLYVTSGIASEDLLRHFFGRKQTDYLIDLMNHLLLLSRYGFSATRSGVRYLVPSMVIDGKEEEEDGIVEEEDEGARCRVAFGLLPNGMFQRLVCLLVAYSSNNATKEPVLGSNVATIQLAEDDSVTVRCSTANNWMSLYFHTISNAAQNLRFVVRILQLIKQDFSGNGFTWDVLVEVSEGGQTTFKEHKAAIAEGIQPWAADEQGGRVAVKFESFLQDF